MQEFMIIDEKRYPLDVKVLTMQNVTQTDDSLPFHRFEHRVTVGYRGRRFTAFLDNVGKPREGPTFYIEETTNGHFEFIDDTPLWNRLANWMKDWGFLTPLLPMFKNKG